MKKYKAVSLVEHINELRGEPTKKVEKLVDIHSIYSAPLSEDNFNKYLWTEGEKDFEIHTVKDEQGNYLRTDTVFYWQQPIVTCPQNIGDFIVVANSLGRTLYWHEDVFLRDIAIVAKY
jgi:hypothetical protein